MHDFFLYENDSEIFEYIDVLKTDRDKYKRKALEYADFAVNVLESKDFDEVQNGLTDMYIYTSEKLYPIDIYKIINQFNRLN